MTWLTDRIMDMTNVDGQLWPEEHITVNLSKQMDEFTNEWT